MSEKLNSPFGIKNYLNLKYTYLTKKKKKKNALEESKNTLMLLL